MGQLKPPAAKGESFQIRMEKLPELPISAVITKPKFTIESREYVGKLAIKNTGKEVYPREEKREIILELKPSLVHGNFKQRKPYHLPSPDHFHLGRLNPEERRTCTFRGRFLRADIYELHARLIEVEEISRKGAVKEKESHGIGEISGTEHIFFEVGLGWTIKYDPKSIRVIASKTIRCYSTYELAILGFLILTVVFSTLSVLR